MYGGGIVWEKAVKMAKKERRERKVFMGEIGLINGFILVLMNSHFLKNHEIN